MHAGIKFGLIAAFALPLFARAETAVWSVKAADLTIHLNHIDPFVDSWGVYGEENRKLALSDIVGHLDLSAGPSQLTLDQDGDLKQYRLTVNYRFSYSLRDYETDAWIADESSSFTVSNVGTYFFDTPDGTFDAHPSGSIAEETIDKAVLGFDSFEPFKFHPVNVRLYASGDYPNAFTLTYGNGADNEWGPTDGAPGVPAGNLYLSLGNGLVQTPLDIYDRPQAYKLTGSLALTPAVPEPETYALTALGLAGVVAACRRKRTA